MWVLYREACAETQLSEREGDACVPLHNTADALKFSCGPRVSGEVSGEQGLFGHFSTAGRLCCWWSLKGLTERRQDCLHRITHGTSLGRRKGAEQNPRIWWVIRVLCTKMSGLSSTRLRLMWWESWVSSLHADRLTGGTQVPENLGQGT